jgi:hypothetical protein
MRLPRILSRIARRPTHIAASTTLSRNIYRPGGHAALRGPRIHCAACPRARNPAAHILPPAFYPAATFPPAAPRTIYSLSCPGELPDTAAPRSPKGHEDTVAPSASPTCKTCRVKPELPGLPHLSSLQSPRGAGAQLCPRAPTVGLPCTRAVNPPVSDRRRAGAQPRPRVPAPPARPGRPRGCGRKNGGRGGVAREPALPGKTPGGRMERENGNAPGYRRGKNT